VSEREPVTMMAAPMRLDYEFTAGEAQSKNLHGYADEVVELPNTGTVTTYCVVNVPFAGQSIEIPYICGQILLDGANLSFMGLLQEIPIDEVRMGLRVEAVWAPPEEWGPTLASVKYFRPNGEPDADYESYKEYL